MRAVLLGTAAGGGFPQWNCACRLCAACRRGDPHVPPRRQDCLAISADGERWYLVNASPDLRAQILDTPVLSAGPGPRETPLRGALLTDAELDHTLGLLTLREQSGLRVWAPAAVHHALRHEFPLHHLVSRYGAWESEPVPDTVDGLRVTAFPVSDKRPKYTGESAVAGPWVVAYRFEDPRTGGILVYAPCLASWPDGFDDLVSGASCVLLDGTFHSAREMSGSGIGEGAQRAMGHIPVAGEHGSLGHVRRHPGVRWVYTHLNNTNPLLDVTSAEYAEMRAAGAEVLPDGTELVL